MIRAFVITGLFGLSSSAFAQSFATDTITTTPGFGTVIDSGPAGLSSSLIDARMATLVADANTGACFAIEWAGTWVRGRAPRVQGATDGGGTVTGNKITNGSVDGVAFSSSLASGGALVGSTADGNDLNGFFARVNHKKSIWYGVERVCAPASLVAYYDFDGTLVDQAGNAPTLSLQGNASLTPDGQGFSGTPGDSALDVGVPGDGSFASTPVGTHFDGLTNNNAVAISWWQNSTTTTQTSSFGFSSPAVDHHALQAHATWEDGVFYFDHSGCCGAGTRTTVPASPQVVFLNQWQHMLVQKDASGVRQIWIDGVLRANQGGGVALPPFTGELSIGAFNVNSTVGLGGRIDDFAVFSEPLTPDQIQVLASGGSPFSL